MGITRTPLPFEKDYVQIPNVWLRDERLSRRARGLLAELMTHRAGWHITVGSLQKAGPEGRDAIRGAVQELAQHGYLIRRQSQDAGGRFNEIEYEINDPTAVGKSDTGGFTDDGSADVGKPAPKNTISSEPHPSEELSLDREFEQAWAHWPKRTERKKSHDAFTRAARRRGVDTVVADVTRFGDAYAAAAEEVRFVPALSVWLNGERWTDPLPIPAAPSNDAWAALLADERDPRNCVTHPNYPLELDGSCTRCERDRADAAAQATEAGVAA